MDNNIVAMSIVIKFVNDNNISIIGNGRDMKEFVYQDLKNQAIIHGEITTDNRRREVTLSVTDSKFKQMPEDVYNSFWQLGYRVKDVIYYDTKRKRFTTKKFLL